MEILTGGASRIAETLFFWIFSSWTAHRLQIEMENRLINQSPLNISIADRLSDPKLWLAADGSIIGRFSWKFKLKIIK